MFSFCGDNYESYNTIKHISMYFTLVIENRSLFKRVEYHINNLIVKVKTVI